MAKRKVVTVRLTFEYYPDEDELWASTAKLLDNNTTSAEWKQLQDMIDHYRNKCVDDIQSLIEDNKLYDALDIGAE